MRRPEYTSVFKDEINEYIDFKIENGYEELSFKTNLRNFDRFCVENSLNKKSFDEELADKWLKRKPDEKPTTHYSRINCVKNFLIFLRLNHHTASCNIAVCFLNHFNQWQTNSRINV